MTVISANGCNVALWEGCSLQRGSGGVRTLLPNEVMDGRMALERKGHTEPQRAFRSKEMEAVYLDKPKLSKYIYGHKGI